METVLKLRDPNPKSTSAGRRVVGQRCHVSGAIPNAVVLQASSSDVSSPADISYCIGDCGDHLLCC